MAANAPSPAVLVVLALIAGVGGGVGSSLLLNDKADSARSNAVSKNDSAPLMREIEILRNEMREMRMERTANATPNAEAAREEATSIEVEAPAEEDGASEATAKPKFSPSEFAVSLRTRKFDVSLSDRLVTRLSMNKDEIEPTIKALKAELESHPESPELWAALGAAHTAKLAAGLVEGPAAGAVYGEVIRAYDKALQYDENHWPARFNKAFTTSMAPEFIGLRPASIRQFEDIVERQEAMPNSPEYARSYIRLGTLYKDAGNAAKAKEIWKQGLRRYPDDKQLSEALAVAEKE